MTLQLHRYTKWIAAGVACAAFAAPTALAGPGSDLRSPDTRDAAAATNHRAPSDLRSPDTRDAAEGVLPSDTSGTIEVTVVRPGGFDWSDAGIGAGAGAGMALLLVGTALLVRVSRREPRTA